MPSVIRVVARGEDDWILTDEAGTEDDDIVYPDSETASEAARELLAAKGGGELVVHGLDGQVRDKEIIGVVDVEELPG